MPLRVLAESGSRYWLVAFDAEGRERADDPDGIDGVVSRRLLETAAAERPTDVFVVAHGWKHDVPAAIRSCDRWFAGVWGLGTDRERLERRPGGFRPFWIGVHWPSQPWGDEALASGEAPHERSAARNARSLVDAWAGRLGEAPDVRAALEVIGAEAAREQCRARLSSPLRDAYRRLDFALGLGADGVTAPPGDDREPFDPDAAFEAELALAGPGTRGEADILGPLRQLSFWTMKKRARLVGERGTHRVVGELLGALGAAGKVRVHLMGHSFGAIVACAMVGGRAGASPLPMPVHSLVLLQGAMSLWSFANDIPAAPGTRGYFRDVVEEARVAGPIVTTRSRHDSALGRFYPVAAGVARDMTVAADAYPRYGALGAFGARGLDTVSDHALLGFDGSYDFVPGRIHNLDASDVINEGGGLSGAHSDIFDPEIAHVVWEAAGAGPVFGLAG